MRGIGIQLTDGSTGTVDLKFNVQRDASGKIISGLCIGDTLNQNQSLLVVMQPGELKEYPTVGAGIEDFILSEDFRALPAAVIEALTADRMKINQVLVDKTNRLIINANY